MSAFVLVIAGCTIGAPGKPKLDTTTSAEQTQRIFWQDVKEQKWQTVEGLLTANVTWRSGNRIFDRAQIVPYLQQLQVKEFVVTNVDVKSSDNDMTVVYDLQLATAASTQAINWKAIAVSQQVPAPPETASNKEKKAAQKGPPYLLTVEDLVAP